MAYDKEKRKKFSQYLRLLATKFSVRQVEIARNVGKTRQHISHIFNGKIIFTAEQFNITSELFKKNGASSSDLAVFNRLFVEAKSSIELQNLNLDAPVDPIKQIIIENLDYLSPTELVNIHKEIEKYKFNQLKKADEESTEN